MEGPWNATQWEPGNAYRYNGKELNSDLGLDWYDYGFRFYDSGICIWGGIDLLAEISPELTPYRYAFNNPLLYTDPDGLFESKAEARKYKKEHGLKGKVRKNKKTGEFEIHLKKSDGRIKRNSETGDIEYAVVASYTGAAITNYEPNLFESVQNFNFLGSILYDALDNPWITFQKFNPFDTRTTHLSGRFATQDEFPDALASTLLSIVPIARSSTIVKSVTPQGLSVLQKLNAARFSKLFKGSLAKAHPRVRGLMNRLINKGVDKINERTQTGNAVFQVLKISSNQKAKE